MPLFPASTRAQADPVQALIDQMTPEQRVGQLMLVTFEGTALEADSEIVRLIQEYHIGGVMLLAANDNIDGSAVQVHHLTNSLQELASQPDMPYIPLFIATAHNGNGLPDTQISSATTPLPSYMALGATWQPDYAHLTGTIVGQELAALGINMLLGPSLDVAESSLLGVQTFGGQSSWVGRLGAAYTAGVHTGSANHVLVIARQFPGRGGIDRDPTLEIPVVPRSTDDLRQQELMPFFAMTGAVAPGDPQQIDGVQCANLRYRNEGAETRPLCLDEAAFRTLATDARYGGWWSNGIVLSDALGNRAVRRWYNIEPFPHRQVARDALLAGNTLLYLADFSATPGTSSYATIVDTLQFFTESYVSDPLFKARVDAALYINLAHKLSLYGDTPQLKDVQVSAEGLEQVGQQTQPLFEIARRAVTLIAPQIDQLPPIPQNGQQIVIFTDTSTQQQCSACDPHPFIEVDALQNTIQRFYGNAASGQIDDNALSSYSFDDLANLDVQEAEWIIFVMLDDPAPVQTFLENAPSGAEVIVLAMGAPTHLTATDISKLSAYYGIYGHTEPFIDAAARAVFQEVPFSGRLPISLPAIGYAIEIATAPDPAQTLSLQLSIGDNPVTNTVNVGDTLHIRTAPILDRNGNPVPDGTSVTFTLNFVAEGVQSQEAGVTLDGIASVNFPLRRAGQIQITARSGDASTMIPLELTIAPDAVSQTATAQQSQTPTRTLTPTIAATRTPNATQIARATEIASAFQAPPVNNERDTDERGIVTISDFLLSLMGLLLLVIPAFSAGWATSRSLDGSIRIVLGTIVAGLTGYVYYGIGAPASSVVQATLGELAAMMVTFLSGIVGLMFSWWTVRELNRLS